MVKRRRRFKQTTTLAERLAQEASRLRERAKSLSPGPEQALLWRKVRQAETALRIDAWLALPHDPPPGEVMPFMDGNHRRRRKPSGETAHDGGDVHSRGGFILSVALICVVPLKGQGGPGTLRHAETADGLSLLEAGLQATA